MKTLAQLWRHRSQFSEDKEWEQLYQLVYRVLKRSRCSELESLPLDITDYIDGFFCNKVYLPATKPNFEDKELFSEYVLIVFFRHYLRDILDDAYLKRTDPLPLENESNDNESDKHFQRKYTQDELMLFQAPQTQDELMLLREEGLELKQVSKSARQFLRKSEEWVRLYLALHTCPDKEDRLPLRKLAKIYQIPAYHCRAKQLGITRSELEHGYEKTLIGQWLLSLDILLISENQYVIEVVLKILCWEALSIYKKKPAPKH